MHKPAAKECYTFTAGTGWGVAPVPLGPEESLDTALRARHYERVTLLGVAFGGVNAEVYQTADADAPFEFLVIFWFDDSYHLVACPALPDAIAFLRDIAPLVQVSIEAECLRLATEEDAE